MTTLLPRIAAVVRRGIRLWDVWLVAALLLAAGGFWMARRPDRQFALGLAGVERQDWNSVRSRAALVERSAAHFPHAQLLWGIAEMQEGELLAAVEDLHVATEHSQTRPLALAYSGEAWYRLRQFGRAEQALLTSLERLPHRVDTHRWLAALYYDTGAMENALTHLSQVARLAPSDARPHRLMGLIYRDYERFEDAVVAYRESLAREPQQPDRQIVLLELAESQTKARQYGEALATLADCSPSERREVLSAECHVALGNQPQAAKILDGVLAQSPDRTDALLLRGNLLLDEGNLPLAIEHFQRCVAADALDYAARYKLAQAYERSGDKANAQKHGQLAEDLKRSREEFTQLHHEAMAQPRNAGVRYRLGQAALRLKRPDLARTWFAAALALDPAHAAAAAALQGLSSNGSGQLPSAAVPDAAGPAGVTPGP
jgi:tetratricopeptide (TPR) repeat protein